MPIVPGEGTTVDDLVDRVFRDYLEPADDRLIRVTLTSAVTSTATSWSYDPVMLAADEEDLLIVGVVVEADSEQALVTDVDHLAGTLEVRRGYNATTAAAHVDETMVTLAPVFGRRTVVDAVRDNVAALSPHLWRTVTDTITTATSPVDVSADALTLVGFIYDNGYGTWVAGSATLLGRFPPSATGKAVQFYGLCAGQTGYVTYRATFARPDVGDDLTAQGVRPEWERIIVTGAAAQVLPGRELDSTSAEFITQQVRAEGYPVLSSVRQASALWQVRDRMLVDAASTLRAEDPVTTSMSMFGGVA